MAVIAFDPLIPVCDRFAKGYPKHGDKAEPATYGPFSEAARTEFGWDAHFCAYSQPAIEHRLADTAALTYRPKMVLFILDVDGPGHKCTPEWWALEKEKVRRLFKERGRGYAYTTKGGYRIVYGLRDELTLTTPNDALRWRASYVEWIALIQREYQIACDEACSDWTRLYRLPRVTRDGSPTAPSDEIGEPDRMLDWREPYVPADDPRCLPPTISLDVKEAAPVPEAQLIEAAMAIAKAWPMRNRHNAGLALAGALARAGWSEESIVDFLTAVFGTANPDGDPWYEEAQASARSSVDKVSRGESVAGWDSLVEYLATGIDGQRDEARLAPVTELVLTARRAVGQAPAIELFTPMLGGDAAKAALGVETGGTASEVMKALSALAPAGPTLSEKLDEICAEVGGDVDYRILLDEAATVLGPAIASAESKSKSVDARPMGMRGREMRGRALPPTKMLVDNLIPARGVGAISGEPKSGKSWDATHITVALAGGRAVFGSFAVQKPIATFYLYLEDPEESVNNRREAIAAGLGLDPGGEWLDNWYAQPRGRAIDIMNLADLCVLVASVWRYEREDKKKIELVVVDPLSNAHSGEEDKRDSMRVVMARLHAVEEILNVAICFTHHSAKTSSENKGRKRGGQKMRGSSAIHGAVDFGIYVSDIRGDSKQTFVGRIESEVKSARGGGVFDRTIKIDDNDKGNAIKAAFTIAEPSDEADTGPKDLADERAVTVVQKLFDQGAPMTRDELKRKIPGKTEILGRALDIAVTEGWIAQKFSGSRSLGFEITDKGREFIRTGGGDGDDGDGDAPASPPTGQVGGFLASMIPARN